MKLKYTDSAKNDIERAVLWYEKQRKGLGLEFFNCVKRSEERIKSHPKLYAVCYANFRQCLIKRFPFSMYYTIENHEFVVVHSIFDNRQDPSKRPKL